MRISDWSSDVCSSDLRAGRRPIGLFGPDTARIVAFEHCDAALGRALVRIRIIRRPRGDQILVIELRAAERAHEEIVARGDVARDLPQPQVGGIVATMPHKIGRATGRERVWKYV